MTADGVGEERRIDVAVGGGTLAAYRFGEPDSEAPLVIAAHGITANSRSWRPVARELAGRVGLVALDLRGRGQSRDLPGPYGVAAHADDVLAVLDHLGRQRAVLTGHSMGAWVVARLAARNADRVEVAVLVDGGLPLPGAEGVDPQEFLDAFLGPSIARLHERFSSNETYHRFWRQHPAFAGTGVTDADLAAFADHDLIGEPPQLRSSVVEDAVRTDGADLLRTAGEAQELHTPAILLRAPRGLRDEPTPMVPADLAAEWAAGDPERREVVEVADVNHYTITLGAGARAVAEALVAATGPR